MKLESGFDMQWEHELPLVVDATEFYRIYDEKLAASFEKLRQNPHYCLIVGLPAPK